MNASLRIFLSHSHVDNAVGLWMVQRLRHELGGQPDAVWYDMSGGLHGGDAWWRTIVAELTARTAFVVLLSPDATRSPWVNDEIDLAWKQKNSSVGKLIVPIMIRPCAVREDLGMLHVISFVPPNQPEHAFHELCVALRLRPGAVFGPAPAPVVTSTVDKSCIEFGDDDEGYLTWLRTHPNGYVVNAERRPRPDNLKLHWAWCGTIQGVPLRQSAIPYPNVWTGAYMKVCSEDKAALEAWADTKTGGVLKPCKVCHP